MEIKYKCPIFKYFLLTLSFFVYFFLISCKETYNLKTSKTAEIQILEDLQSKRVIFLGENHDDVFPILFLTKNLEKFYNAGVRFLFLEEESDNYLNNPNKIKFAITPPWIKFGYKFEMVNLEKEVERINNLHKDDKIIVIWPESGLEIYYDTINDSEISILNLRDNYSQRKIIQTLEQSPENQKAIILYGSSHGKKDVDCLGNENLKKIGYYLNETFLDDFSTYLFLPFYSDKYKNVIYNSETQNDCRVIPQKMLSNLLEQENGTQEYDYYCVMEKEVFGVPYFYVPEKANLNYLISIIKDNQIDNEKFKQKITIGIDSFKGFSFSDTSIFSSFDKKLIQSLAKYYSNYHLSKNISIDFDSLEGKDLQNISYNLSELQNYMEFLYSYGWLEDYLYSPANDERIGYILYNMKKAKELNKKDIWPQYWISYFKTEQAIYSGKKSDYKKSLQEWNVLLENDLVFVSPILELAYRKMALCEEKLGNIENQQMYINKAKEISSSINIDYEQLVYFGY